MEIWRLSKSGEGKNRELLFNGYRVSVWDDEKVLEMDGCDGHTTM
jgi:predicted metalloprotease